MFYTGTNQPILFEDIPEAMLSYYEVQRKLGRECSVIIGTDSQNIVDTKVVSVICMLCAGHGGIFFYEISHVNIIRNVQQKLRMETTDSLELAEKLIERLETDTRYQAMYLDCPLSIHVDAGNSEHGKTKELIPELVGWVKACGYGVKTKPDSFVASTIADRISK